MSARAKQLAFDAALVRGNVRVMLDPSHADAILPEYLRASTHVVLEYGRDLVIPIPDLRTGPHGVSATLSFNRRPTPVFVPWAAVFAIVEASGLETVWPADMPRALVAQAKASAPESHPARGLLHLVKGDKPS